MESNDNMNKSLVIYINTQLNWNYIIAHEPQTQHFHLIKFDPLLGYPVYSGIFGIDIFSSENDAIMVIIKDDTIINKIYYHSLIGYVVSGKNGYLFFTKSVKHVFSIFNTHPVYSITDSEFVTFNLRVESKISIPLEKIKSYRFSNNSFLFSTTYDVSYSFGKPKNTFFKWNQVLSKSMIGIKIPCICPSIIRGAVLVSHNELSSQQFYAIIRQQAKYTSIERGLNAHGICKYEYEIDFYIIQEMFNGLRVFNHVLRVGDINLSSSNNKYAISDGNDKYLEKLRKNSEIENITSLLFASDNDSIHKSQAHSILNTSNVPGLQNIKIKLRSPNNQNSLVELFWSCISQKVTDYGFSMYEVDIYGEMRVISKQKGVFRVPIIDSLEIETEGLFYLFCKLFSILQHNGIKGVVSPLQRLDDIESFTPSFIELFAQISFEMGCFLSDTIPMASFRKDYLFSINHFSTLVGYSSVIVSEPIIMFQSIPNFKPNSCVSLSPGSFIYAPNGVDSRILSGQSQSIQVPIVSEGIIVSFPRPFFLSEIILELPSSNIHYSFPISVSINGGYYLNRMFPIVEDLAMPQSSSSSNNLLSFSVDNKNNHDPNYRAYYIEPIRFLQFFFESHYDFIHIVTIFIYGQNYNWEIIDSFQNIVDLDISKYNYLISKASSIPKTKRKVDISNILSEENKRLHFHRSIADHHIDLVKGENVVDSYNIGYLLSNVNTNEKTNKKKKCDKCSKVSLFVSCDLCGVHICPICQIESSSFFKGTFCSSCLENMNILYEFGNEVPKMITKATKEQYPFVFEHIEHIKQIERAKASFFARFPESIQPTGIVYDVPLSESPFELLFYGESTFAVDSKSLSIHVFLSSYSEINFIEVETKYDVSMIVRADNSYTYLIEAPISKVSAGFISRELEISFFGERIDIKSIVFLGQKIQMPDLYSSPPPLIIPKVYPVSPVDPFFNYEKVFHFMNTNQQIQLCGVRFGEFIQYATWIIFEIGSYRKEYIHRTVPKSLHYPIDIFFPSPLSMSSIRIWYIGIPQKIINNISSIPVPLTYECI